MTRERPPRTALLMAISLRFCGLRLSRPTGEGARAAAQLPSRKELAEEALKGLSSSKEPVMKPQPISIRPSKGHARLQDEARFIRAAQSPRQTLRLPPHYSRVGMARQLRLQHACNPTANQGQPASIGSIWRPNPELLIWLRRITGPLLGQTAALMQRGQTRPKDEPQIHDSTRTLGSHQHHPVH
jgi:hypothetical protein